MIEVTHAPSGKKAIYNSTTNKVVFFTKNGVLIECEVPKTWRLKRINEFIESLFKADEILT